MAEQGNEQPALEDEVEDMEDEDTAEVAADTVDKQVKLAPGRRYSW